MSWYTWLTIKVCCSSAVRIVSDWRFGWEFSDDLFPLRQNHQPNQPVGRPKDYQFQKITCLRKNIPEYFYNIYIHVDRIVNLGCKAHCVLSVSTVLRLTLNATFGAGFQAFQIAPISERFAPDAEWKRDTASENAFLINSWPRLSPSIYLSLSLYLSVSLSLPAMVSGSLRIKNHSSGLIDLMSGLLGLVHETSLNKLSNPCWCPAATLGGPPSSKVHVWKSTLLYPETFEHSIWCSHQAGHQRQSTT